MKLALFLFILHFVAFFSCFSAKELLTDGDFDGYDAWTESMLVRIYEQLILPFFLPLTRAVVISSVATLNM